MSIDAKKIQIISQIASLRDVYKLEQIARILGNNAQNASTTQNRPTTQITAPPKAPEQPRFVTQTTAPRRSSSDDQLDALIEKNMPTPEKSLSIEEIRALAANAEKALKDGKSDTHSIFKAIKE